MAGNQTKIGAMEPSGLPVHILSEKVESDDVWGIFRLSDEGLRIYKTCPDLAVSILNVRCGSTPAVTEIARRDTKADAEAYVASLSREDEDNRFRTHNRLTLARRLREASI